MKYKLFSIIILFAAFIFANIKFSDFKYKPININKVFPYKADNQKCFLNQSVWGPGKDI